MNLDPAYRNSELSQAETLHHDVERAITREERLAKRELEVNPKNNLSVLITYFARINRDKKASDSTKSKYKQPRGFAVGKAEYNISRSVDGGILLISKENNEEIYECGKTEEEFIAVLEGLKGKHKSDITRIF